MNCYDCVYLKFNDYIYDDEIKIYCTIGMNKDFEQGCELFKKKSLIIYEVIE